jgi:chemotaxis protein MotB
MCRRSMKRSNRHSYRRASGLAVAAVSCLALAGCVTRGTYETAVGALEAKNAQLEARLQDLERSNRALDDERAKLIDEMEDLRQARDSLTLDVAKLEKSKALLTGHLRAREEQVSKLSETKSTYEGLVADLESEVASGQIQIQQLREGLRLNLPQDILFPSGSVTLDPRGAAVLRKVAAKLREDNYRIEVHGHSDNIPLSRALAARWGTNWELAAARAAQVVRLFQDEKIDPARMSAVSFGEYAPLGSNDTPEGRARNRRIEIRLIPVTAPAPDAKSNADTRKEASAPAP